MKIHQSGLVAVGWFATAFVVSGQTLYVPGGAVGNIAGSSVGIGTNVPGAKLEVNGNSVFQDLVRFQGGTNVPASASGIGGELFTASGNVYLQGFNRSSSTYAPLHFYGSGFAFVNGNVGMGTTNPGSYRLHLNTGSLNTGHIDVNSGSNNNVYVALTNAGVSRWLIDLAGTEAPGNFGSDLRFDNYNDSGSQISSVMTLQRNSGNVGIGTVSPSLKVEVANGGNPYNLYLSGLAPSLYFGSASGTFPNGSGNPAAAFVAMSTGNGNYSQGQGDLNIATQSRASGNSSAINFLVPADDAGNYTLAAKITRSGNVGIGTTNPTQKLSVNGSVRAHEVIVDTGWSDYVFDESYKLKALSDTEAFVKTEKHLPGIPSAKEVAEHGISVGEMQAKLLAKIEELTLHVIAQEKRINEQQTILIGQQKHLSDQQAEIATLRSQLVTQTP
jgi:hypothetical protein